MWFLIDFLYYLVEKNHSVSIVVRMNDFSRLFTLNLILPALRITFKECFWFGQTIQVVRKGWTKVQCRDTNYCKATTQSKQDPKCRRCINAENPAKVAGHPGDIWEACECSISTAHNTMRFKCGAFINHFCAIFNICTMRPLPLLNMNYDHEWSLCEGSGLKLWLSSSESGGHWWLGWKALSSKRHNNIKVEQHPFITWWYK